MGGYGWVGELDQYVKVSAFTQTKYMSCNALQCPAVVLCVCVFMPLHHFLKGDVQGIQYMRQKSNAKLNNMDYSKWQIISGKW